MWHLLFTLGYQSCLIWEIARAETPPSSPFLWALGWGIRNGTPPGGISSTFLLRRLLLKMTGQEFMSDNPNPAPSLALRPLCEEVRCPLDRRRSHQHKQPSG